MNNKLSSILKPKYILIALTIVSLGFIATSFFTDKLVSPLRNAVSIVIVPFQKGMNYMGLWVSDSYDTFQDIQSLMNENSELKNTVDALKEENNQLKQDTYELDRLRDLYELDQKYPGYSKVGARIIGTTTDNWYSTFTIDKGSNDGIAKNMNVIAGGGLVGIVTDVGPNYSIVKTVIEDGSYVSGMLIDSGETCAVRGDIALMDAGYVRLQYFKGNATVRDGDKIVTSNISDKYLPGILIGYAKDVEKDANGLTQSGYLVPAVDFQHLQEVLVITQLKETGQ